MAEWIASIAIASVTGMGVLNQRLHSRITDLDRRIDGVELSVARDYVSKTDLNEIIERVEGHMVRIENKLDRIIIK